MNRLMTAASALGVVAVLAVSAPASAHVGLSGPVRAGGHEKLTFRVGHGCAGADVVRVEIQIPESVTSLRAMPSAWGEAQITRDDADLITSVAWEKADARDSDDHAYEFELAITVPDVPFTALYFKTTQHCRDAEGTESQIDWHATPEEIAADPDGGLEPAPRTIVLPTRTAGWNEFETPVEITDMGVFGDAQIVWAGDRAYSPNETTAAMIEADDSVETLESVPANTTIWVKY